MKLPRDLSGADLVKALAKLGYSVTRQKSSHIRLTTDRNGQHHVTVPDHDAVKIGTLADILKGRRPPPRTEPRRTVEANVWVTPMNQKWPMVPLGN